VLIASGDIDLSYFKLMSSQHNLNKTDTMLMDINKLSGYIYHDKFWRAQIEQIYVKKDNFELIPRVGTQIIEFGDISNYEYKFKKLKALYEQGFSKVGWNKYKTINLKYNNQIICTKK
jgi:cell division protein FtsQ